MIDLPNGCSYSKPYVNPCDWDQPGAFLDTEWYIEYWFFDPTFKSTLPRGKRCNFKKGFAAAKTLDERRKLVKRALKDIKAKLESGYNPIIKQTVSPGQYYNKAQSAPDTGGTVQQQAVYHDTITQTKISISPQLLSVATKLALETEKAQKLNEEGSSGSITVHVLTPDLLFIDALWKAYRKISGVPNHLQSVRGSIRAMNRAAFLLQYLNIPINRITPQHIILCFEVISKINPKFSAITRNKTRSHLVSLFKELALARAVLTNFILEIPVLPEDEPLPKLLEDEEIELIDGYLKANYYHFWRFVMIFYSSGARETELAKVRVSNVDLKKREFTVWVLKGRVYREVIKPIPLHVLHIWQEVINDCHEYAKELDVLDKVGDVVLFSKFVKPGFFAIRPDQFGRRWTKYVKKELGINKDMYKLKHLYSDRIARTLSLKHAQEQNSHEYESTTEIYAFREEERRREELKSITVPFSRISRIITPGNDVRPAKAVSKLSLQSLDKDSLVIINRFINLLKGRPSLTIPTDHSFLFHIEQLINNLVTHLGEGGLYRFSEGFFNGRSWVAACDMEFYLVHNSLIGRIKNRAPKAYACQLIHYPMRKERAIAFKDGKIVKAYSGISIYLTQFAGEWLRMLDSQYYKNTPAPGEGENYLLNTKNDEKSSKACTNISADQSDC